MLYPDDIPDATKDRRSRETDRILDDIADLDLTKCEQVRIYLEAIHLPEEKCNGAAKFLRANADQAPFPPGGLCVGMNEFMMDPMDEDYEEDLLKLIELTTKISFQMHRLCYEADGDCTSYGNSSSGCSVVSPEIFRKFAKPFEIQLH